MPAAPATGSHVRALVRGMMQSIISMLPTKALGPEERVARLLLIPPRSLFTVPLHATCPKTLLERYSKPLLMQMQTQTQMQIAFVRLHLDLWVGGCLQSYMGLVTSVSGAGDCSCQNFLSWWQSAQRKKSRSHFKSDPPILKTRLGPFYPHLLCTE